MKRFFCDFDEQTSGANNCLQDLVLKHLGWEPLVKQTNCSVLWSSPRVLAKRAATLPAPARVPDEMQEAFSYRGLVPVRYGGMFFKWPNVEGQNIPWHRELVDEWREYCRRGWIQGS